jgi:hypothetical protein
MVMTEEAAVPLAEAVALAESEELPVIEALIEAVMLALSDMKLEASPLLVGTAEDMSADESEGMAEVED